MVFHVTRCVTRDQGVVHVTKPSHQPTPCSTCIIQNCWRRGRAGIRPRHRSRVIYGTWSSLRSVDVRVRSYVVVSLFVARARLTDARIYVAWGIHGRKPARTATFVGRNDPLDSILLHGLCARRPSVLGARQFGGDQFDRHGELRFDAFLVTLTDSRIGVDDVCSVVWVRLVFSWGGK